mmetsp:Transcript_40655/g.131639  ORF Transcript_40655/g.131639 Transcript_40655/m.131639 type:complete len:372 (-) Transcript_40655:48-1163(-)
MRAASLRRSGRRRRRPQHDHGVALLLLAERFARHHRRERELHPVLRGRAQGLRALDANLVRPRPGRREARHPVLRGPHRVEVLWQPDGLGHGRLPRQARLHPLHLRRGVLRHWRRPRAREGRHVCGARVAADPGRREPRPGQANRRRRRRDEEALGEVRAELLCAVRLRGRRQARRREDDGGDGRGAAGPDWHDGRWHEDRKGGHVRVPRPCRRLRLEEPGRALHLRVGVALRLPPLGHGGGRRDDSDVPRGVRCSWRRPDQARLRRGQADRGHRAQDLEAHRVHRPHRAVRGHVRPHLSRATPRRQSRPRRIPLILFSHDLAFLLSWLLVLPSMSPLSPISLCDMSCSGLLRVRCPYMEISARQRKILGL